MDTDEELRACEWLAGWFLGKRGTWDGPAAIVLRAHRLVLLLRADGEPVDVVSRPGEHFRLRLAPGEALPVYLDREPDHSTPEVRVVLFVPPSLAVATRTR